MNKSGEQVWFNLCGWCDFDSRHATPARGLRCLFIHFGLTFSEMRRRNEWYAPPDPALHYAGGVSLGNSWRISGDGGSWHAITTALNVSKYASNLPLLVSVSVILMDWLCLTVAKVTKFNQPGGYSDPDNILGPHGTVGKVSESQARVQMILWSLMPTQLILGEDVTKMSDEYIETVGNEELIAVNQVR